MENKLYWILSLLIIITLTNCSKEEIVSDQENIIGTWISLDKTDTLYFTTKNDFYKSNGFMVYDHYDYQFFQDSLEIGYRGKLYILIEPSKHQYSLENDFLTIDFADKGCYGFNSELITYEKVFM